MLTPFIYGTRPYGTSSVFISTVKIMLNFRVVLGDVCNGFHVHIICKSKRALSGLSSLILGKTLNGIGCETVSVRTLMNQLDNELLMFPPHPGAGLDTQVPGHG